jgi:hypothetical protein
MYIVGTPSKTVTRSRAMTSSTFAGSNRVTSDIVQPKRMQTLSWLDRPKTWNSGSATTTMSSGSIPNTRPGVSAFISSWKCVSSAPLGVPVVPEV